MDHPLGRSALLSRPLSRRQLLALSGSAGIGALGLAVLGPALTTSAASRDERGQLRATMRKLWEDHVVWTRMVIVSALADTPDLPAATQRLLANQDEIGNAIVPFFGADAGAALSALLREHILIAAAILTAAKAGDDAGLNSALADWYANADEIAAFLHGANPRAWPLGAMTLMMREHLDLTLAEAVARLQGDWEADVAAYDRVHDAILLMADMLADGLLGLPEHGSH